MSRLKAWWRALAVVCLLAFANIYSASAAGSTLEFVSEDDIVIRLDNSGLSFPVAIKNVGTDSIRDIQFKAVVFYIEGNQTKSFDEITVTSDKTLLTANQIQIFNLQFALDGSLPDVQLHGHLVMTGNVGSVSLAPAVRTLTVNPEQAKDITVSFPSDEKIALEVDNDGTSYPIIIRNNSTELIHNITFKLVTTTLELGKFMQYDDISVSSDTTFLKPSELRVIELSFKSSDQEHIKTDVKGVLLVEGTTAAGTSIASVSLPIEFKPPTYRSNYIWARIIAAAFFALLILGATLIKLTRMKVRMTENITLEGWSRDSWVSLFTAGTGILGLGVTLGFAQDVATLIPTGRYALLGTIFALAIPIAPLCFFLTLVEPPKENNYTGKVWGFLLTSGLVLWGAMGQVFTLASFAYDLATSRTLAAPPALGITLLPIIILVFFALINYSIQSLKWEIAEERKPDSSPNILTSHFL